jgi:hypothetical protein
MTDTITETKTPTQELRAAAKTLRCKHRFLLQPPHGSLAHPSDCTKCGVPHDDSEQVEGELAEKLADLFDHMADDMQDDNAVEFELRHDDGRRRKYVRATATRPDQAPDFMWSAALKLARSISGTAF